MLKIPEKLLNINPYDPSVDKYEVKLDANESYMDLPLSMKEKIISEISNISFNRYPDPSCTELIATAAKFYGVTSQNIACGNGSDELISIIISAFNNKGDKILVCAPDFSMYNFYAGNCEVEVISSSKDENFIINTDDVIKKAMSDDVKMVIFSNPCNPTGQGLKRENVLNLIKSLKDTLIIVDEAYMDFWDESESVLSEIENFDNLLVLKTMSKAFGLASVRLGISLSNTYLAQQIHKVRSPFNMNTMTQAAGTVLFENGDFIRENILKINAQTEKFSAQVKMLCEKYKHTLTFVPTVTNFVNIKTDKCDFIYGKLLEKSICIRNFAKLSFLRITVGSDEENKRLLDELENIVKGLSL